MARLTSLEKILDFVVKHHGKLEFSKPLFAKSWGIASIRAAYTNELDYATESNWNNYAKKVDGLVGSDYHTTWIYNKENKVIGVIAFFDVSKKAIKTKSFFKWAFLLKVIQQQNC